MSKSRGRPKDRQGIITPPSTAGQTQRPSEAKTIRPQPRTTKSFGAWFSTIWFYASIAIILLQFAYSYRPRLAIEANVAINSQDPLSTLFRIVNTGPLHLNDITITCVISAGAVRDLAVTSSVAQQA